MKKSNYRHLIIPTLNLIVFVIVIMFQACSRDYGIKLESIGVISKCREGQCVTSQINPDLEIVRPPTKVLFVIDNSRTMNLSQTYLANGTKSLVDDLHGFNADFFVYTTSDSHLQKTTFDGTLIDKDDKPVISSSPLLGCHWEEIIDGIKVKKSGDKCPNNQPITYNLESINLMNSSLVTDIKFRSNYDENQLRMESESLSSAITGVGVDGSSTETGLCTLVRSVYNETANKIFNKGDNAAMVIVSDEEDSSDPLSCLSRQTQEETFSGKSIETQSCSVTGTKDCNPTLEKFDAVDYEVKFNSSTVKSNYAKVTTKYSCDQLALNSCAVGENCTKVNYSFQNLRSKVRYSCLNKVDYKINFNAENTFSRSLNYSCFNKVPYTISFNPISTYSQSLNYQCVQKEDGVPVATSVPQVFLLHNTVSNCVAGTEVSCDSSAQNLAESKCQTGTNLLLSSCKLKCLVGSQNVSSIPFNDLDATAPSRDLTTDSFTLNSLKYSSLADWALKTYPQYVVKHNGIVRGSVDSMASAPLSLTSPTTACTDRDLVNCDKSQIQLAQSSCGVGNNLTPESCKVKCNTDSKTSFVIYSDTRANADQYNLINTAFIDPSDNQTYSSLNEWGNLKFSPKTVSSIERVLNKTSEVESFLNENCSVSNSLGNVCLSGSTEGNFAATACGTKKVSACTKICIGESNSLTLTNLTDDKVNYCTNTNTNQKFSVSANGKPLYSSIKEYATATLFPGQTATLSSCSRTGDGFLSVSQPDLINSTSKSTCDGNYSSIFDMSTRCHGTSPLQNGITANSPQTFCSIETKTASTLPAITKSFTYSSENIEDICNTSFSINGITYSSLKDYMKLQEGRSDEPISCKMITARKTLVPSGVVSVSKITKDWTYPTTVMANSADANLEKAFLARASDLFGDNGFFVSAIIRDTAEDAKESNCLPLGADQSIGTKYSSLVNAASSNSTLAKGGISSICATDYSKALKSVSKWIKENARRTVYLPEIQEGYEILSVWFVNESTKEELKLSLGTDYEIVGNKVNFINPLIDPKGWLIKYMYWIPKNIVQVNVSPIIKPSENQKKY